MPAPFTATFNTTTSSRFSSTLISTGGTRLSAISITWSDRCCYASFLLDRSLYGNSSTGYHLLNLLLHLGSGLLVYLILTRAVTKESKHIPFWTAVLFLIHPIQTETVTYISGRASGLMAFFYLLALLPLYRSGCTPAAGFRHLS